jgi:predicted  nucleic acid-binding Zn-ribbon protein
MNQAANILQSLRKLAQLDTELCKLSRDTQRYQEILDKIESQRGVCGACHLSIPIGRVADLRRKPAELNVCDNCGAFIYLSEDESAARSKCI